MAKLIYKTDFENIVKLSEDTSSIPIPHRFNTGSGIPCGSFWMEGLDRYSGITPHSGSRCVGMEVTDLTVSDIRNEFNILDLTNLVGSELFVSVWLYLPANWGLFDPGWNWYALASPMFSPYDPTYLPYWELHIVKPPSYCMDIDTRGLDRVIHTIFETPLGSVVRDPPAYPLPRGRWFNLKYYVLRGSAGGAADGAVKVWIDDRVVCDLSGIVTGGHVVGENWGTCPADIYGSLTQVGMPYKLWVDDLEIWDGMPPVTPIPPTHILVVTSTPITGIPLAIDGQQHATPTPPLTLLEGSHSVSCPSNIIIGSDTYNFSHWEDGSTNPTRSINLMGDATITAMYQLQAPPQYTLTISLATTGGTTNPTSGSYLYDENNSVEVSATPSSGYNFDHWTLDGVSYSSNPIILLMNKDRTLVAYFSQIPPPPPMKYKLSISATSGGSISPPQGIIEYAADSVASAVATPSSGYSFQGWTLDGSAYSDNPINILMNRDHVLLAVFAIIPPVTHLLAVTTTPISGVPISIDGQQYLTPTPPMILMEGGHAVSLPSNVVVGSNTYNFGLWEDGSSNPQRILNLTTDTTLTASYVLMQPPPLKGRLEVHAFLDSTEIVADGLIVETGQTFQTPAALDMNPGTYAMRITVSGKTSEQWATVTESQTVRLDFQFITAPIPSLNPLIVLGAGAGLILLSTKG